MSDHIKSSSVIKAEGNKPKIIREYFGNVNSNSTDMSIAKMESPEGWIEPGQRPEFDEYTIVLRGLLRVKTKNNIIYVKAGESIHTYKGEWIQYSTPEPGGAEYIAVCIPAFSPDTVHRDE